MIYIGQDDAAIIAFTILLIICIALFIFSIVLMIKKDFELGELGVVLCVSSLIMGFVCWALVFDISHCYKIKIVDKNVTVNELTDKFIIKNYVVRNDIWYVYEKDGGYSVKALNNDNN